MTLLRVAVLCDYVEENWPSMDLVADMLFAHLQQDHSELISATKIQPKFRRRFTQPDVSRGTRFNADRLFNRFRDYPRLARLLRGEFDVFHLVDHSYSQLVHELPADKTIVTCHDLDTFQCLLDPAKDPRSLWFRKMMERSLSGFKKAARITCDSVATRDHILAHELVPATRTIVVPNGVDPLFSPATDPVADREASKLLGPPGESIDLLHVGSTIARKRIDTLLGAFAIVKKTNHHVRLIRVGDDFTYEQKELLAELDLTDAVVVLPRLNIETLAAIYRRAALVLMPSEREGFGLPVVEAMASGTLVLASDLPVLREIGAEAISYCPVGDVAAWSAKTIELLEELRLNQVKAQQRRDAALERSRLFTWKKYTSTMVDLYQQVGG